MTPSPPNGSKWRRAGAAGAGRTGIALQEDRLPGGPWGEIVKGGLLAASWLYGAGHASRMSAYRAGIFKTRKLPCWVISVGNLTAGGTGKTPVVLSVARALTRRGRKVAVLSRGWGGRAPGPVTVVSDGENLRVHPPEAADEAYLLASRLPGVPVLTGKDRYALGERAAAEFGVEGVLLDDGFQHVQLDRDLNLLLLDADRPYGNGRLLPRGTLREPRGASARADGILITRADSPEPETQARLRREYPALPIVVSRFVPDGVRDLESGEEIDPIGKRVFLVCGIARPSGFRQTAIQAGLEVAGLASFPDHHVYTPAEAAHLRERARTAGAEGLLTTEKDAVKLRLWPEGEKRGGGGDPPAWSLRLRLEILSGEPHWEDWTRGPG